MNEEQRKEYKRKWAKDNPEKVKQYSIKWIKENPEKRKQSARKWAKNNPEKMKEWKDNNLDKVREYKRRWKKRNPGYQEEYIKRNPEKYKELQRGKRKRFRERYPEYLKNPRGRLDASMSTMVRTSLKGKKSGRSWKKLVGYTIEDLIKHLENLFESWMTWDNYGKWEIDHKKPQSLFKYKTAEDPEFKKCWALSNLQPLEKSANRKKSNHYKLKVGIK